MTRQAAESDNPDFGPLIDETPGDVADVLAALGISGVTEATRITSGWGGTTVWRLEREGRVEALRIFPQGAREGRDREVAALNAAAEGGIPVPDLLATKLRSTRPVIMTTWCAGRSVAESAAAAPWRVQALGVEMGRMQARIHRIEAPESVRRRSPDWIAWAGEAEPEVQASLRALPLRPDALLHLDYHPQNVLIEDGHVSGVLDWENVRAGDPRADVARTASILWLARQSPETARWARPFVQLLESGWRRGYQREAGPLTEMPLFAAWACAAMIADLSPKVASPENWLRPQDLDKLRHRLATLKRRAGL